MNGLTRALGRLAGTLAVTGALATAAPADAQTSPAGTDTRAGQIAAAQAEKAREARAYRPPFIERIIQEIDEHLTARQVKWHPFYGHAYPGAGLTAGVGYMFHTGDYDTLDVRAAMSLNQSKRAEMEFTMPRLFARRAILTAKAGWREGREQAFFGLGTATALSDRTDFDFRQTHAAGRLDIRPLRNHLVIGGGGEVSRYEQRRQAGSLFDQRFPVDALPGAGATVDFVQAHGTVALDWRPAAGYAQRGGAYGIGARRVFDLDGRYSFSQVDYDIVQHIPIGREAWVLSLHGRAETTYTADGDEVPFFMLPTLGNATTLRGFANQRFRDRNSLLLSAEWRVLVNRFTDLAFFYDTGKVAARRADLDFTGLKHNYGIGLRLHSLASTPIRIELARGSEGLCVVFGSVAAF